jgi:hypothetical protein
LQGRCIFFVLPSCGKAKLVNLQFAAKVVQQVQPAANRWGSPLHCLKSLKDSEATLHQIVTTRDLASGTQKQKQRFKILFVRKTLPEWITMTWWGGLLHQRMETKNAPT